MDVQTAIRTRRSVRQYSQDAIPEEKLKKVLEAGRLAPSAHNDQPWQFIVVKDEDKKKRLAEAAAGQSFIADAPAIIVGLALHPEQVMSCGVPSYAVNLAIALDHMTLAAVEQGLGTCWIGAFSQEEVKRILDISGDHKIVALLPCGFPADEPLPKTRKSLNEIVSYR